MDTARLYKISFLPILFFMVVGILLFILCILAFRVSFWSILIFLISAFSIGSAIHLWRKRREGKGFYWDEEGVVIDLTGHKVYWHEIEDIQYFKSSTESFSRSTVIYPHYTHHEKIRSRRKKWLPTTAHSVDWFLIENPKEYHKNLINEWEQRKAKI